MSTTTPSPPTTSRSSPSTASTRPDGRRRPVPVLPFALPGSEELATAIAGALADPGRTALLLRNHGTVTVGDTLARAHARAVTLEWLAGLWHDASLHGDPAVVTDAELAAVAEHLTGYFDR